MMITEDKSTNGNMQVSAYITVKACHTVMLRVKMGGYYKVMWQRVW